VRLIRVVVVLVLLAALAFATVRPFRIAVLTVAVVPELLDTGPKVLSALIPRPERVTVTYGDALDFMDIYLPAAGNTSDNDRASAPTPRYPAVVLVLGVNPVPRDHPAVVRTAEALARLGLAVAVPESAAMRAREIRPAEPGRLVEAFEALAARPEINPGRIGFAGFSVGGSVALMAAADPRIADRLAYVNAFGAYADPATFLADIVTRSMTVGGRPVPWQPGELTRTTYLQLVLGFLDDPALRAAINARLEPFFVGEEPPARPVFDPTFAGTLRGDALVIYELSTAPNRPTAQAALDRLSAPAQASLRALSPVAVAAALRAPIYLMHDEADDAIPYSHLARLVDAVPPGVLERSTLFALFDHVQPRHGIDPAALPEIWKLAAHLEAVMERALPD